MLRFYFILSLVWSQHIAEAQSNALFTNLPVGKYSVGFKIITLIDKSRVTKPMYSYLGKLDTAGRYKTISIHLWYPATAHTGKGIMTYGDYGYSHVLKSTAEVLPAAKKEQEFTNMRQSLQRFFGDVNDADWNKLLVTALLAEKEATPLAQQFPLLIGMLRPISTTITNEVMASNGYVVAMVSHSDGGWPDVFVPEIEDLHRTIAYLAGAKMVDGETIGTYGFSGSGFTQVLFAMNDMRIKALADIESGVFMNELFDKLSSSNFYNPRKLQVPFLHLFSKDLSKEEIHIDELEQKMKFSNRYRVILNTSNLHHWDFATEGRTSTTVLHMRGEREKDIRAAYELSNIYLLHFFNSVLKKNAAGKAFLDKRPVLDKYNDSLWTVKQYIFYKAPPDKKQFAELINNKGIDTAIRFARQVYATDTAAECVDRLVLNQLAWQFRGEKKPAEGEKLFQLAVELYPQEAWIWLNLAAAREADGDIPGAIGAAEKILELLKDFHGNEVSQNGRVKESAENMIKRLKK